MREQPHPIQKWLRAGLDLLFPVRCAGCGRLGAVWCDECDRLLIRPQSPLCPRCGLGLGGRKICPSCSRRAPSLQVRSHARYSGKLVSALLQLKYRPDQRLAQHMAGWLARLVRQQGWPATVAVPVPLGRSRRRRRGFNQAGLLSRQTARVLGIGHATGRLRRLQETRSQVGLSPGERWDNVAQAFGAPAESFREQRVLLVDDLMTTGATLSACADALRRAGATQVWGVTVARA